MSLSVDGMAVHSMSQLDKSLTVRTWHHKAMPVR